MCFIAYCFVGNPPNIDNVVSEFLSDFKLEKHKEEQNPKCLKVDYCLGHKLPTYIIIL